MSLSVGDTERATRALARSIIKRDNIVSQFGVIATLGSAVESDFASIPVFHARSQDLALLLAHFHAEQDAILDQLLLLGREHEFNKSHTPIETHVTDQYYLIKAIVAKLNLDTTDVDNSLNTSRTRSNIQLPKIQLPTFDGNLSKWCSYRDTFVSLVHENTLLSDTEKFHYLISTVKGTAEPIVKAVPLTEANYVVAWDALQEMYNNKRVLVTNHLDIIFHLPTMMTETLIGLTEFLSTFRENIAAIRALEVDDLAGFLLFYIASRALCPTTKRLFEAEHHTNDAPTIDLLLKFVHARCQILQNSSSNRISATKPNSMKPGRTKATVLANITDSKSCKHCRGSHFLHQCTQFIQLPVNQRFKIAQTQRLCMNCLSPRHKTGECSSTHSCKQCAGKHHTLLHLGKGVVQSPLVKQGDGPTSATTTTSTSNMESAFVGATSGPRNVILGTATLRIQDSLGHWVMIRALVDTGSQISVITSAFVAKLGLKRRNSYASVTGLAQTRVPVTKGSTKCVLTSLYSEEPLLHCEPMILTKIVDPMPSCRLKPTLRHTYTNIVLADPQFDVPAPIDFLLGADLYPLILGKCSRVIHQTGLPSAYETTVGWIILGKYSDNVSAVPTSLLLHTEPSISHLVRTFWEIEEPSPPESGFTEEQKCEEQYVRTTIRDSTGRFTVSLPFRRHPTCLGDSRSMAISRFYTLERKLQREPLVYEEYRKFMAEYEQLGHMSVASGHGDYYIPHHAVVKGEGTQLKLRVVFDASASSTSGKSLNELLHVGPKLQLDIAQLLHRCRFRKYMFTADICKMYRQIQIHPDDRRYQRIVWRSNPSEELKEFELNTVTYGVASSPFQAIRTLHQLEKEDGHQYPHAKNILTTETYVDDIISGHNNLPDLLRRRSDLITLLSQAGLILKKWASNCTELINLTPLEDRAPTVSFDRKDDVSLKILGLYWDPYQDSFTYYASNVVKKLTKRSVLSAIAKLYDPIGGLAPITFMAKCFMQTVWQSGLLWDDKLPVPMLTIWEKFVSELPLVSKIKVHRHIPILSVTSAQLLGFSDASEKGYAAVVYLRLVYEDGRLLVRLVTS